MSHIPRLLIASAAAAVLVGLAACAPTPGETAPTTLKIGVEPSELNASSDPLTGASASPLAWQPVYETLFVWDIEAADYVPWLAEEFVLSDDRLLLTLTLRDDVDFTDGVHFDAKAVETYFAALLANEEFLYYPSFTGQYHVEVTATGEYEVEISAENPMDRLFMRRLSDIPIASPEALDDLAANPVGTGPYLVDELVTQVSATFVRNPDYWNPEAFAFDTVEMHAFDDRVAALNALKSGQIDATMVDTAIAAEAEREGFVLHAGGSSFAALFIMDIKGVMIPALGDVRVRQAMNLAFDREAILESLDLGLGKVSSQIGTLGQGHFVEDGDDHYPYDLDAARDLMADAGYEDGFDLAIPTLASNELFAGHYEAVVQQSLADIGIRVTYVPQPDVDTILGAFANQEYPVALLKAGYTNIPLIIDENGSAFPGFHDNPTFVELVAIANTAATTEESDAAWTELGEYMLGEAWFVPFAHPQNVWATDPEIEFTLGTLSSNAYLRLFELAE